METRRSASKTGLDKKSAARERRARVTSSVEGPRVIKMTSVVVSICLRRPRICSPPRPAMRHSTTARSIGCWLRATLSASSAVKASRISYPALRRASETAERASRSSSTRRMRGRGIALISAAVYSQSCLSSSISEALIAVNEPITPRSPRYPLRHTPLSGRADLIGPEAYNTCSTLGDRRAIRDLGLCLTKPGFNLSRPLTDFCLPPADVRPGTRCRVVGEDGGPALVYRSARSQERHRGYRPGRHRSGRYRHLGP